MKKPRNYGRLILFDTLAVLCFIGVALFGWLPGPGGIPLFLLGLSFLAVNHEWAERWLETAKHKGVTFKKWLFPNKTWVKNLYDLLSIAVMTGGVYVLFAYNHRLMEAGAVAIIIFSLFVFLLNRDRSDRLSAWYRRRKA